MQRSSLSIVIAALAAEHLLLAIAGHRGQPLLHCMACKRSRRDDHNIMHIFYLAGFVDRTRPAIRPLKLWVLVIFLSLGGLTGSAEIAPASWHLPERAL